MENKHKDKIFQLRSEGKSYSQIQKILGCSKGTISYHLGEGQKEKSINTRGRLRTKIREYIQVYKESVGCVDCKEMYPYYMLDLDHLRDKEFGINRFFTVTVDLEKVKEEMAKCEVVCANCHRIRTQNRINNNKK
jgi:transposase